MSPPHFFPHLTFYSCFQQPSSPICLTPRFPTPHLLFLFVFLLFKDVEEKAAAAALASQTVSRLKQRLVDVPTLEWWDVPLLKGTTYEGAPTNTLSSNLTLEAITHYVEHPIPIGATFFFYVTHDPMFMPHSYSSHISPAFYLRDVFFFTIFFRSRQTSPLRPSPITLSIPYR